MRIEDGIQIKDRLYKSQINISYSSILYLYRFTVFRNVANNMVDCSVIREDIPRMYFNLFFISAVLKPGLCYT